jgi:CRISPR-associated protein (TIGR03986 family)
MVALSPEFVSSLVQWAIEENRATLNMRGNLSQYDREDVLEEASKRNWDGDEANLILAVERDLMRRKTSKSTTVGAKPSAHKSAAPKDTANSGANSLSANITAPFRFVALNEKVAFAANPQSLSDPTGTFDAVINVDWAVETPLLIGEKVDGIDKSFMLDKNTWAIPGSTLRGMLRAALETIAFARLSQINHHRRFALRDFANEYYKGTVMKDGVVKAGWLQKMDGVPKITECDWEFVDIDDLRQGIKIKKWEKERDGKRKEIERFATIEDWAAQDRKKKYADHGIIWSNSDAFKRVSHYFDPIKKTGKKTHAFSRTKEPGYVGGYLVFSGPVHSGNVNKLYDYVFFDKASSTAIKVEDESWNLFLANHSKPSANKQVADGAWKDFESTYNQCGRIPIFFTGDLAKQDAPLFSFGLTRLYRLPHKYSVGQVLLKHHSEHQLAEWTDDGNGGKKLALKMDFVEHLFGYVHEPKDLVRQAKGETVAGYTPPAEVSRKGRVAVGFATAQKDDFRPWPEQNAITTTLGTPKPSFGPFYLAGEVKDWSNEKAKLAGRKRYFARETGQAGEHGDLKRLLTAQNGTGDTASNLQFIIPADETKRLTGQIRLHHVSMAELGAILWVLGLGGDKDARHLVGRAKAFGAGRIRAASVRVNCRENNTGKVNCATWAPHEGGAADGTVKEALDAFESTIAELVDMPVEKWRASPQVQGLLEMSRPIKADRAGSKYLSYQDKGEKKQAERFAELRKTAGTGSGGYQDILLPAEVKSK